MKFRLLYHSALFSILAKVKARDKESEVLTLALMTLSNKKVFSGLCSSLLLSKGVL